MSNIKLGNALHRAFSVFLFHENKLLLQQRSMNKITFPGCWTNTCCSHPLWSETERNGIEGVKVAAIRKIYQELGISGIRSQDIHFLTRVVYQASCDDGIWGEHEIDYILVVNCETIPIVDLNPNEVMNMSYVDQTELDNICIKGKEITPWFKLIREKGLLANMWSHLDELEKITETELIVAL